MGVLEISWTSESKGADTVRYQEDFNWLLSVRKSNGADFWATQEGKLGIEKPVSTLTALMVMGEMGVPKSHEALNGAAKLVLAACGEDGRVRIAPKGSLYPCHTAMAAVALSRNGFVNEPEVQHMLRYLRDNRYQDGGWRCNKYNYGKGEETEHSNTGVTLLVLDALRYMGDKTDYEYDSAVETLLSHWTSKAPIGPCHYGIGTLFMQVEYPFLRYNLFYYVYVLSHYAKARMDGRFLAALDVLREKLDDHGGMVVERPNKNIAHLTICRKGVQSEAATERYLEIVENLKGEMR
jgi:hypothetical protein